MLKRRIALFLLALLPFVSAFAEEKYSPFILAYTTQESVSDVAKTVEKKLQEAGFEVVGNYKPYDSAQILVITNEEMKYEASRSKFGGYGAALRVAITDVDGVTQVSYNNPVYLANGYRMSTDYKMVANELASTLGMEKQFGTDDPMEAEDIREYLHLWYGVF